SPIPSRHPGEGRHHPLKISISPSPGRWEEDGRWGQDERLLVLASAAWQVLAARYARTPSAPAFLALPAGDGRPRPLLLHTPQSPDAPVRELLAAVADELRTAAVHGFYLEQPDLPDPIAHAFGRPETVVLSTTSAKISTGAV